MLTCQEHVPERIVEQIIEVQVPLPILEGTVREMKLAPHEHTQTVEFLQPQFINKVVEAKQSRSLNVDSETKVRDSQQRTDAADAVPESSEEKRDTLNQAVRAWNIECLQYEIREIIFPASIKKAMEMQAEA